MKNPEAMRKAHEEVDEILGDQQIQLTDISKLKYIEGVFQCCACLVIVTNDLSAVMRETLRLNPTAPIRVVRAVDDIVIGNGKYFVPKDRTVVVLSAVCQRDPAVWGEDVSKGFFLLCSQELNYLQR